MASTIGFEGGLKAVHIDPADAAYAKGLGIDVRSLDVAAAERLRQTRLTESVGNLGVAGAEIAWMVDNETPSVRLDFSN